MKMLRGIAVLLLLAWPLFAWSATHSDKMIEVIHSPDHRSCTFFRLQGVTIADPDVKDNPWFAVPLSHNGHAVILSLLLSAASSGQPVTVTTDGTIQCTHAGVANVKLHP